MILSLFNVTGYAQYEVLFSTNKGNQFQIFEKLFHQHIFNNNLDTALNELKKIKIQALSKADKCIELKNEVYTSIILFYKAHKIDSSAFLKQLNAVVSHKKEPLASVFANIIIGQYYWDIKDYQNAFANFSNAGDVLETNNLTHTSDANELYFKMSMFYYGFKNYDKALEYSIKGTQSVQRDDRRHIQLYNIKALCFAKTDRTDSAMHAYEEALVLAKKYGDTANIGVISGNIGQIYKNRKEWNKAIPYIQTDNELCAKFGEWGSSISAKMYLVNIFINQGKLDSAKKYIEAAEPNTHKLWRDDYPRFKDWYEGNANYYTAVGNYQQANLYKDSILYAIELLSKINTVSQLDEAEMKVAVQKYTAKLQAVEQNRKRGNLLRNIIAISFLLIAVIVALLFRYQLINRKKENDLALQKETLFNAQTDLAEEKLAHAEDLLDNFTDTLTQNDAQIQKLITEVASLKEQPILAKEIEAKVVSIDSLLKLTLLTDKDWLDFKPLFETIYPNFFAALKLKLPALTPAETRLVALTKINMSSKEMAAMLAISPDSVKKAKQRLTKKLLITEDANLQSFVNEL